MLSKYQKSLPVDCSIPFDSNLMRGKSVLVTGGSSGLGYAYCEAFSKVGALVTNADFKPLVDGSNIPGVQFIQCDIRNWDEQREAFSAAVSTSLNGRIDVVVANAGISGDDPFLHDGMKLPAKSLFTPLLLSDY
ncbi:hypothetical protein BJY01DRAFT_242413 [Aspergillus pseudoustus]|uniref:NAD(P)-binding protein n=1 Tax=Aspergillus pseudoustus TaxID=1810923 RepID=A0ABR4KYI1_9EURO